MEQRWQREGGLPPVDGATVRNALTTGPAQAPPWLKLETKRPRYRLLSEEEMGPAALSDPRNSGCVCIYDWATKQTVWQSSWGNVVYTPMGFCLDQDFMYLNDLEGSSVFTVDLVRQPGRLVRRISHPYMNDLHGLCRTRRGLLVASTGTDAVLELDLDGNLLYDWWAADHGYRLSPAGVVREAGRGREHRDQYYHTRMQTTHLNKAVFRDPDERLILIVLFHQGQVIQVDRSPAADGKPLTLVSGLARPHGLTRTPFGWVIANSAAAELITFDDDFHITGRYAIETGGWLQDVRMLSNGHFLVNDVDNHCVLELAPPHWREVDRLAYHPNWRMAEIVELPPRLTASFTDMAQASMGEAGND